MPSPSVRGRTAPARVRRAAPLSPRSPPPRSARTRRAGRRHRELREVGDHVRRRTEEDPRVRRGEHGRVVVRVAGRDDAERERAERLDGAALPVRDAQPVARDPPAGVDLERVAEERRPAELPHERRRELAERVGEDDDLRPAPQPVEERGGAVERRHRLDHRLDVAEPEPVLVEDREPAPHQDVVVRLVAGGAPERGDPRALGHVDPDLRDEDALEVEAGDQGDHWGAAGT
jgi:hypothetical protein